MIAVRAHLDNPENSLYLKIINLIPSTKAFFPCKVTFIGSGNYGVDMFWGAIIQPTTAINFVRCFENILTSCSTSLNFVITKLYFLYSIISSTCISEHPTIRKRSFSPIQLCFHLCIYVSMGSWIFILFYGFKFIAIIIYFDAQIVPDLAGKTPFELIPVSF